MAINRIPFASGEPNHSFKPKTFARQTLTQLTLTPPAKRDYQTLSLEPISLQSDGRKIDCILRAILDGHGELQVTCEVEGLSQKNPELNFQVADSEEVSRFSYEPLIEHERFSGLRTKVLKENIEFAIRCALAAQRVLKGAFIELRKSEQQQVVSLLDSQILENPQQSKNKKKENEIITVLRKYGSAILKTDTDIEANLMNRLKFVTKISLFELYEVLASSKASRESDEEIIKILKPYGLKTNQLERVYFKFNKDDTVSIYEEKKKK